MRILFATVGAIEPGPQGPTSRSAGTRHRVLMPAAQLARLGHQVQVAQVPTDSVPPALLQVPCDVLVLSDAPQPAHAPMAEALRERGVTVVADASGMAEDDPVADALLSALARHAQRIVVDTAEAVQALAPRLSCEVVAVPDAVEGRRADPAFEPRLPALRLACVAEPADGVLNERADELLALAAHVPLRLSLVAAAADGLRAQADALSQAHPSRLSIDIVAATPEATLATLQASDAVWLPGPGDTRHARWWREALWAGRLPVGDGSVGDGPAGGGGLVAGLQAALADPARTVADLRAAQRRLSRAHSAHAMGLAWAAALGDATARPLRLNLGCGDKILPGYVNVDVVESRAGQRPDVVCDLHALSPFDDDSADEILSVHVVEHFWRWEVHAVLREWVRVLKPGAPLILECPNLRSACETFLQDPERFARADREGQRTMWVFYGDPQWQDPLMIHRWGYTPQSLQALLREVGLKDVRQEPAQFKLREPRDMRVVGIKP